MRTIAAIVLFAAAGVSAVSAQTPAQAPAPAPAQNAAPKIPFAMDHGRAADAAARAAAAENAGKAATAATASNASQSASFSINGESVIRPARLTPEQQKAEEEGRAAWQARCRPTAVEDRDGMRRTKYAAPDCDLSRFNTVGK
jgi:hypothetical protein